MKLLYILYNISKVRPRLLGLVNKAAQDRKTSSSKVITGMLADLYKHNTYIYDYFEYRFFEKTKEEKQKYCDRLLMYNFHKAYNSKKHVDIFTNKIIFHQYFKPFISHQHFVLKKGNYDQFYNWIKENSFDRFVIKHPTGQAGSGVIVCKVDQHAGAYTINGQSLEKFHAEKVAAGYTLVEEYVVQHEVMLELYPNSVNTLRIISQLHNGEVEVVATMLRMGLDKSVDNFSAGGISAEIETATGIIRNPGLTRDPFDKVQYVKHPKTNYPIVGLKIPYFQEALDLVKKAALVIPDVKTVGWDVVITSKGPSLIEGNQNWDKNHWELTYQKGFRNKIENYLYHQNAKVAS